MTIDRSRFLAAASSALVAAGVFAPAAARAAALGRILTLNTVIRKYQFEKTRTEYSGGDETELHDADRVFAFSDAVRQGFPSARITWGLSWFAILDPSARYAAIREAVKAMHRQFGDDVAFAIGGYHSNIFLTREAINRELADANDEIAKFMDGYRPRSLIAGFLAADNIAFARSLGMRAVQGNVWSQYAVDLQDDDGSIAYPYYPAKEHFAKPAGSDAERIDAINFDGWTIDLVAARLRAGYEAKGVRYVPRMGVGPLETLVYNTLGLRAGLQEIKATTEAHFEAANLARNPFAWVTNNFELGQFTHLAHRRAFSEWIAWIKSTWPDTTCPTLAEFADALMTEYPNNDRLRYILHQKGSGIGASFASDEIVWVMNKMFRLGFLKQEGTTYVIDYTDYRARFEEPQRLGDRNWNLWSEINQKGSRPQDAPVPLERFTRWPDLHEQIAAIYGGTGALDELITPPGRRRV